MEKKRQLELRQHVAMNVDTYESRKATPLALHTTAEDRSDSPLSLCHDPSIVFAKPPSALASNPTLRTIERYGNSPHHWNCAIGPGTCPRRLRAVAHPDANVAPFLSAEGLVRPRVTVGRPTRLTTQSIEPNVSESRNKRCLRLMLIVGKASEGRSGVDTRRTFMFRLPVCVHDTFTLRQLGRLART